MVVVGLGKIRETAWEQDQRDGHALMLKFSSKVRWNLKPQCHQDN